MFEGSLVESRGLAVSGTQRWTALGSLTLQLAVAGLLLAIPMLRPEALPSFMVAPHVELPPPMKPPLPAAQVKPTGGPAAAMSVPAAVPQLEATQRFTFPLTSAPENEAAPTLEANLRMGTGPGGGIPGLGTISTNVPAVVVRPEKAAPLPVSSGVTEGMLLAPIRPAYPPIAVAARVQGPVVMEAVISKAGRIESLHVLSGPEMLCGAALAAVQAARYRPYLLSGEPTEVRTTITVVFTLGS